MKYFFLFLVLLSPISLLAEQVKWKIAPHFQFIRLKFDEPEPIDGYMAGIQLDVEKRLSCVQVGASFEGSWDTNFLRGDPAQKSSVAEYLTEIVVGPRPCCFGRYELYPYTGFGWHRLENKLYPQTITLRYRYDKLFVPLGIKITTCSCQRIRTSLQIEWRPDVYSKLHVNQIQMDNQYEHGLRVQMPFEFEECISCSHYNLTLVPFFDWAQFGASKERNPNQAFLNVPPTRRWGVGLKLYMNCAF